MLKVIQVLSVGLLVITLAGCRSEGKRVDPSAEPVTTHEFNPTDLRLMDTAVDKLVAANVLSQTPKPFMYVKVRNLTDEHVDTSLIVNRLTAKLSETGLVRLAGYPAELEEILREIEFQQGAFVDPETSRKIGEIHAAGYFLQGDLGNLSVKSGRKKGQYFQFTLKLIDIETAEVIGVSIVDIQKVSKKPLIGW